MINNYYLILDIIDGIEPERQECLKPPRHSITQVYRSKIQAHYKLIMTSKIYPSGSIVQRFLVEPINTKFELPKR